MAMIGLSIFFVASFAVHKNHAAAVGAPASEVNQRFQYEGCYENIDFRPVRLAANENFHPTTCLEKCGMKLFAMSNRHCYCSGDTNTNIEHLRIPEANCHHRCEGYRCGGFFSFSVFKSSGNPTPPSTVHVVVCSEGKRLVGAITAAKSVGFVLRLHLTSRF